MPGKTKVAHLGPHPEGRGGMPAVIRALLQSPLADSYDLEVIPTYDRAEPLRRLAYFLRALPSLVRWCAGRGKRIVHVHVTVRGSMYRKSVLVAVAKLMRRPVVLHLHAGAGDIAAFESRIGPVPRALFRGAFRRADAVLSVSQASATEIEHRFGVSDVVVVPNAAPLVTPAPMRDTGDAVRVLYLGGFANQAKGGAVLAEALPSLVRECPSVEVTLAGPGEPPASLAPLLENGAVRWRGWLDRPSKEQALAQCDIFVLPSISEGLPLALLEAMSCARAIVATRVGGVPEVVEHGANGVLVDAQQPELLVKELTALAKDGDKRLRLGRAARASAERLNADEVSGRLDAVYGELVPPAG